MQISRVLIYPQDSRVGPPVEDTLDSDKIGHRLEGPRFAVYEDTLMRASADADGNYLIQPDRRQFDQVQAFTTAQKTLDLFEQAARRTLPWAFESSQLAVAPHMGEEPNAYYQRWSESLQFFYFDCKPLGQTVQTSQSADIVSHETGHAILDGLKPEYGRTFDRETKAFHEAFGDCAATLLTLSRPANRASILAETGGDLSKDSCLSRIAEEFGTAVRLMNHDPSDDRDYLRNSKNDYRYVDPNTLPNDGPRDVLTGESHSFCQVWSGAFYRALKNIYDSLPGTPDQRLAQTGVELAAIFALGVELASPARARYGDMAGAMLRADQLLGGQHQAALQQAFADSAITPRLDPVPDLRLDTDPQAFLAQHADALQVDPAAYEPPTVTRDDRGLTVLEYLHTETRTFGDRASDVRSGLTLAFDASGQLLG